MYNKWKYTEWSTDVKLLQLAYKSQKTTTLGFEMVLNQKPCKSIMFTANLSKKMVSVNLKRFDLLVHTFSSGQQRSFLSSTNFKNKLWNAYRMNLEPKYKTKRNLSKNNAKSSLQRQNVHFQLNSRFTPASKLKIGTNILTLQFYNTESNL